MIFIIDFIVMKMVKNRVGVSVVYGINILVRVTLNQLHTVILDIKLYSTEFDDISAIKFVVLNHKF